MPDGSETDVAEWSAVVGSSLAFLCLHYAEMRGKTLLEQAGFLERLALSRRQAAVILGTTEKSLNELERQRRIKSEASSQKGRQS